MKTYCKFTIHEIDSMIAVLSLTANTRNIANRIAKSIKPEVHKELESLELIGADEYELGLLEDE